MEKKETLAHLKNAYVELLMIEDISTRLSLNDSYCLLRDSIAGLIGSESQEVQEMCEELALNRKITAKRSGEPVTEKQEKLRGAGVKTDSPHFKKFFENNSLVV